MLFGLLEALVPLAPVLVHFQSWLDVATGQLKKSLEFWDFFALEIKKHCKYKLFKFMNPEWYSR